MLARRWSDQGRDHAGLGLSAVPDRGAYGELLRRLLAFLDTVSAEEMANQVRWLDPTPEPDR